MYIGLATVLVVVIIGFFLVKKTHGASEPVPEKEILCDMGDFTTNLSDSSQLKYIKIKVVIKLDNYALKKEVKEKEPILRDSLIGLLNTKSSADMMADRSELKATAIAVLNNHLVTGRATDIYFSDLVMQ